MLLLDHNLPHQLRDLLTEFGLRAETARYRGWETLRNGELVAAAHAAGFKAIVTRDRKFAESAAKALVRFPQMAIVVLIPENRIKLSKPDHAGLKSTRWAAVRGREIYRGCRPAQALGV